MAAIPERYSDELLVGERTSEQTPTAPPGITLTMGPDDGAGTGADRSFVGVETEGGAKAPPAISDSMPEVDMFDSSPASGSEDDPTALPPQTSGGTERNTARASPRYGVGQWVRTTVLDEPLMIVDVSVYGPLAQYYMLVHPDPQWTPPGDRRLSVNTNYGRPRICVELAQITGTEASPTTPSWPESNRPETLGRRPLELSQENEQMSPEEIEEFIRSLNTPGTDRFDGGFASSTGNHDPDEDRPLSEEEFQALLADL